MALHPANTDSHHLRAFLEYLEAEAGLAENTIRSYRGDLENFLGWLATGPVPLSDVDTGVLTDYLQSLRDRSLAASSIARRLSAIRMFFRFLVYDGVLIESAVDLFRSPRLWQRLPKVLSQDLVDRLISEPGREKSDRFPCRDRSLLGLMYATGCRTSEVTGLELRNVQLADGLCRCTGKGNKERMVYIASRRVRGWLADYLDGERPLMVGEGESPWLFVTRRGNRLSRVAVWNLVKKYAPRAGASAAVSPHTLRHTFATHMLAGGAGIRELQELLGHASIATTQLYTQVEHSRL